MDVLARSVELIAQWVRILAAGPLYPVRFGACISVNFIVLYLMSTIVSVISFMRLWFTAGMRPLGVAELD